MAKLLVGLAWLWVVFDFGVHATASLDERSIIEEMYAGQDQSKSVLTKQMLTRSHVISPMKQADYIHLNFYVLPVGQGEAQILQCPNGDITIIDLGSSSDKDKEFWSTIHIQEFLYGHNHRIKNIVITHNDSDHYRFFSEVFSPPTILTNSEDSLDLMNLENVYISCTFDGLAETLQTWLYRAREKVQIFNNGGACGYSLKTPIPCGEINLCPGVTAKVLSANAGGCKPYSSNADSIVMVIKYRAFSMQLNGDFEGIKLQDNLVKNCPEDLQVTVYKLAHHGADSKANSQSMCDTVKPKAVFVSSDPWHAYGHPRCSITDHFIKKGSLCKPAVTDTRDTAYCGRHPINELKTNDRLQTEFACGCIREEAKNQLAIYSTAPAKDKINLIRIVTDGKQWGFVNSMKRRLRRN